MDTKWKKSKTAGLWIGIIIVVLTGIVIITGGGMLNYINDIRWIVLESGESEATPLLTRVIPQRIWIVLIASGAAMLVGIIMAVFFTGQRDLEGKIRLNRFDRIYTEIKLIMLGGLFIAFIPTTIMWLEQIKTSDWCKGVIGQLNDQQMGRLEVYYGLPCYDDYSFIPQDVETLLLILAFVIEIFIAVIIVLSIVKRIKDHSFCRSFFVYDIIAKITDGMRKSERVDLVVLGICIACTFLSSTIFGSALVLLLLLIFVPKLLTQYKDIRKGVNKVKEGDIDYKIPVTSKTDLGRLATSINDISNVTSIAVQNEIKHQKMKTDLISNVSHDLKTPLTSMISYLDLLKREGLDSENAEEYLRILDEKTQRLKILTEELFEAAKASSGEMPVNLTEIEVGALVSQAVAELEERLQSNNLDVIFTDKVADTKVIADGQLLWRVVENLLVNVSKYALPHSRVYIDLEEAEDKVVLEIKNMSKERLNISVDELMERFKRGDDSRNTEGSGLGLAIARDLTSLIGGEFNISIDGDLFKATVILKKRGRL